MNILLIKLKNCLGVKELELKPGKITMIQGKGRQGKTSIDKHKILTCHLLSDLVLGGRGGEGDGLRGRGTACNKMVSK